MQSEPVAAPSADSARFTETALQKIRQRLLDLTRRNRLLNYRETAKTIVVRDELPDVVYGKLLDDVSLTFSPLDEIEGLTDKSNTPASVADADLPMQPDHANHHDND